MRRLRLALGSIGGPEESRSAIKIGIIGFQFGLPLIGTDHAIPSCVTFFNHHFQVKPNYKLLSLMPHMSWPQSSGTRQSKPAIYRIDYSGRAMNLF